MLSRKVRTAKTGNDSASCLHVSSDSHHNSRRGGGFFTARSFLLATLVIVVACACDPLTGTGPGTPPDPKQYLKVDAKTKTAIVTLIAGYPATDYQFNYDGYGNGSLVLTVPVGWEVTVQCANHSTVPNSCAVVASGSDTQPVQSGWTTPDQFMQPIASGLRYHWVLARLAALDKKEMHELVMDAWRMVVPKSLAETHDPSG